MSAQGTLTLKAGIVTAVYESRGSEPRDPSFRTQHSIVRQHEALKRCAGVAVAYSFMHLPSMVTYRRDGHILSRDGFVLLRFRPQVLSLLPAPHFLVSLDLSHEILEHVG